MRTSVFSIFHLLVFSLASFSQVSDPDMGVLEKAHLPGFVKEKKPVVENLHSRNYYLNDAWQLGSIELKSGQEIPNILFKYDIVRHILEIKDDQDIYVISVKSVNSFYWVDSSNGNLIRFEPVDAYYNAPEAIFGFFEVSGSSESDTNHYKLLTHHSVWLYPATTSVSLSGSHKSNDIFWKEDYYLSFNGELNKLDKKRKNNYSLFNPFQDEMKGFIRKKGLSFRKKADISLIFKHYIDLLINEPHQPHQNE